MIGDAFIQWFNLFSGIVVYTIKDTGASNNDGWVNIDELVKIFVRDKLRLNGKLYDGKDKREEEALINAIISNANILCMMGVLEKNRGINPPRLEYRVTKHGRKLDSLSGTTFGEFQRRIFFFRKALFLKASKHKKLLMIITVGAFLMAVVNAIRFYSLAFTWLFELSVFAILFLVAAVIAMLAIFKKDA
ncbi:MAG: hypothetical protein WA240_08455 [Nitrospirota bacterium]